MDKDKFERVEQIFADAADLGADRQDAFAVNACAGDEALLREVRALLRAAEGADDYFTDLAERLGVAASLEGDEPGGMQADRQTVGQPGMNIGAYTLSEPVGSGGTGTVWRAARSDGQFEGHVAIKIINPDAAPAAAIGRLRGEAQHLARLSHPNIARLLDAGVDAEDRPYLVLEYVDGTPIDTYCDRHQFDIAGRIRLFVDVLHAVAHAHAHLIVHRDIKPANVLVDETGTVKLLDFGIARLLQPETGAAGKGVTLEIGAALTPEFAAPEQLVGQAITTATDVYSLGLLLYVMLAGCNPRQSETADSFAALVKAATQNPPKPSTIVSDGRSLPLNELTDNAKNRRTTPDALKRLLRGDLDNILRKALAPEPENRYQTATGFAADLGRYLNGEPVSAMPPTVAYRMQKFVGRHRGGVASALLTALALIAALAVATLQMLQAREQRDLALYQQQRVQASNEFYSLLMEEMGSEGQPMTAVELLDRGAELLKQQYDVEQPFVGRIHYDLSRRYSNLREKDRELELLGLAEATARANNDDDLLAATLCTMANSILFSDPGQARQNAAEGNAALAHVAQPSLDSRIACLRVNAQLSEADGDRQQAIAMLVDARQRLDDSSVSATHLRGVTLGDLGNLYYKAARYDESLSVLDEILRLLEETGRGNTLGYLQVLANRSVILGTVGEVVAEAEVKQQLIERLGQSGWGDSRAKIPYQTSYGGTLVRLSRYDEGIRVLESVRQEAESLGSDISVAQADLSLARAFAATGRFEDARTKVAAAEAVLSNNPRMWEFQSVRVELIRANIARKQGRLDEARAMIKAILDRYAYPPLEETPPTSLVAAINAATMTELAAEDYAAAEKLASDFLQTREVVARRPEASADVGNALFLRAQARIGLGKIADAESDLERAVVSLENGLGKDNPETVKARQLLQQYRP